MSISAWCDLNTTSNIFKLHDNCPNVKGYCQKQVTFTPEQFQLEAVGFKNHMAKTFEGTQTEWKKLSKPAMSTLASVIGLAVEEKSKNPQVGRAATKFLKSNNGGKVLSPTDMHGNGFRLQSM